jgi:hypothetical protein
MHQFSYEYEFRSDKVLPVKMKNRIIFYKIFIHSLLEILYDPQTLGVTKSFRKRLVPHLETFNE